MTALNLANIPNQINSYEKLAVWSIQCLQSIANGDEVNAINGVPAVPIAQCQIAVTADNVDRFVLSAYVPCDRNALNAQNAKTWMAAQDISLAAPHANLLSN